MYDRKMLLPQGRLTGPHEFCSTRWTAGTTAKPIQFSSVPFSEGGGVGQALWLFWRIGSSRITSLLNCSLESLS